jgi:hypothetical protein
LPGDTGIFRFTRVARERRLEIGDSDGLRPANRVSRKEAARSSANEVQKKKSDMNFETMAADRLAADGKRGKALEERDALARPATARSTT